MPGTAPPPWHTRPVGLLAVLFYLALAADYLLRQLHVGAYVDVYPAEWLGFLATLPGWIAGAWAVAVWLGLLGAVLLLRREALAVLPLAIGFLAALVALPAALMQPGLPATLAGAAPTAAAFGGMILAAALLWLYARLQKTGGRLD